MRPNLNYWEILFFSGLFGVIALYPFLDSIAISFVWVIDFFLAILFFGYIAARHLLHPVGIHFRKYWQEIVFASLFVNIILALLVQLVLML